MLVQPRKDINTLALNDPEITGGVLLPDGIWGVNLAAARLNFPDKGLKCQIPPWNNMDEGDKVELLLHGAVMDQKTIYDASEIGERVTLFVPPKRLLTGASTLSYKVTRFSQRPEEGPTLTLFVKLELPGGQDTDPDYGHSELAIAFLPESVVRDGVDKDNVKDGVVVIVAPKSGSGLPYPNAAAGDVIHVGWAGQTVLSAPLTQAQVDAPDANPVRILIDEATLLAAGDSDLTGLSVSYMIRDRVLNQSEDWCKEARIVVDTGNSRLLAPILKQADGLILDLEKLGDDLPLLKVWAEDSNEFSRGDVIVMRLTGTTAEDKSVDIVVRQSIDKNPPVEVDILHSNPGLRSLGTRSAIYSYGLERNGKIIQRSKSRTITVVGEPTRLAAPIALDAPQGALDPDAANYRIRIPYDLSITADNAIELKWFGTRPDNTSYDPALDWYFPTEEEASAPAGFIITVEGRHGKTLEGGSLDLSYNLLSAGENDEIISRASQHAARLIVGEPKFELVPPIVLGEKDGALEPADLPGGVGKLTAPRPVARPTEANDIVTYTWFGEVSGEKVDFKKLNALSKDKDVDFTLDAAFVAQHIEPNRGKKVTVRYRIFRDASKDTSYSNVLEFVVGQAVALDPPTIDSVKGSPSGKEIVEGGTTVETSVVLSGTAAKGKNVEIRDGATVKDQVTADPVSGIWTYTASGLTVTKHSFTATGKYGAEPASAAYTLTVTTVMVPTLSNVLDDKGMEVPDRQTTVSTSLTLKGSASKGQDVEVYDGSGSGAVSKGMAKADEITGLWERTITVAVGARRLYAKSLYHSSSVYSNVRYLSVIEDIAPTIDSANGSPSGADILPGGTTSETAVTLSGNAANGQNVEVFDGAASKGPTTADPTTGVWTLLVSALAVAEHSFTAKALYGNGQTSAARTLTVAPAFIIETSTLVISGRNLSIADSGPRWLRTGKDPAGTTADRTPSSGVPPYRYRSGDSGIASVEETTGRVRSEWNGTTRIYVTDSLGRDASYEVIVRNVLRLIKYPGGGRTSAQALAWRQSLGGALIGPADLPLLVKYARVGSPDYDNGRGIDIAPLLNRPTVAPHARPGHYIDYLVGGTVEPWTWWILDGITNPTPDNYISTTLLVCLVP
ncbi:Ig-like domain-containing protein [Pseudomonas monsensis]|uniref:Ig-like domain-containing protein n=1 Tax=Pseudomonas monsensis TaxID=2745509 RepID=UPI001C3CC78E|nr:Ig-like domain-containing protein [Pseudomonas monsensis]QXI02085.1 Ig-like domain-containing protein [Pseudomonas monsensis]